MSSVNVKAQAQKTTTHEGAITFVAGAKEQLERTVMSCMLWEDGFYEDGISISDRIIDLIHKVKAEDVYKIAVNARNKSKLRHVPLLIAREMARIPSHKALVGKLLLEIIQRPDELTEFLAIYWKDGRQPVSAQVKKGLASWEVEISAKGSNKESWERLLTEKKLGGLALIRNLRNMTEQNVEGYLIKNSLAEMKTERILPFRFIAAARYAPDYEPDLESAMYKCMADKEKLSGKTVLLLDVSGSMDAQLSEKSDMTRNDAAYGLGILARELCEDVKIFSFSSGLEKIPLRRGFALRDAINNSQDHSSTYAGRAIEEVKSNYDFDRMIVITDEQSHDTIPNPKGRGYIINVASYEKGIGYGSWTRINGWSESVFDYILQSEK